VLQKKKLKHLLLFWVYSFAQSTLWSILMFSVSVITYFNSHPFICRHLC
jgi:hypothetical protein